MNRKNLLAILGVAICVTLLGSALHAAPCGRHGGGRGCPGRPGGWHRPCQPCRPCPPPPPPGHRHHGGGYGCHYNDFDRAIRMTEAVTSVLGVLMMPRTVVTAPPPPPPPPPPAPAPTPAPVVIVR